MSRTLQKVISAGQLSPGTIPTKIYIDKGKGNICALEPVDEISKRYEKAVGGGASPMVQFTDYRGNPSCVHSGLIKGFTSLCTEQQMLAAGGHVKPLPVQNIQQALSSVDPDDLFGILEQIVGGAKANVQKQLDP